MDQEEDVDSCLLLDGGDDSRESDAMDFCTEEQETGNGDGDCADDGTKDWTREDEQEDARGTDPWTETPDAWTVAFGEEVRKANAQKARQDTKQPRYKKPGNGRSSKPSNSFVALIAEC